jgi:hypothetical protein
LSLESFNYFRSGAFYGKIRGYRPDMVSKVPGLIEALMQEDRIRMYKHIEAEVCLVGRDFLNPEGGGSLDYYVEHLYCTSSCQTGTYRLRVDMEKDGSFVGYRHDLSN